MEEAVIKRVMPHDDEAESSVIGAMLIDNEAIMVASELIKGEDFYQKQLGIVYNTMVELYSEGKPVEPVILHASLREKGMPEEVCGPDRILQWMNQTLTSANIKYYAEIVSEKSVARRLIRLNEEIANTCYAGSEKLEDTLAEAEKRVFDLVQRGGGNEFVPIRQVVINVMKKIDAASRARGRVTGLETGFMDLDYKTSGLQPSDLVLIARPSMGKTAFVLNLAQHMAFKRNHAVAVFSLEMSKEQLVNRMLSLESHVDAQKIRTGRLTDEEWMNLVEGSANIANSKLIIDDTPGISLSLLRSKCRRLKIEHDIQIVIIDYLQLMSGDNNGSAASRQQEISDISRGLKALAREMNVPVVALSQLSRAVEQRPDHRPMLSDLRESGAIEQDADVVMFLYREGYYNRDLSEAQQRVAEVIIAKQRNGPIGTVNLLWMPELTKFSDMERSPEQ